MSSNPRTPRPHDPVARSKRPREPDLSCLPRRRGSGAGGPPGPPAAAEFQTGRSNSGHSRRRHKGSSGETPGASRPSARARPSLMVIGEESSRPRFGNRTPGIYRHIAAPAVAGPFATGDGGRGQPTQPAPRKSPAESQPITPAGPPVATRWRTPAAPLCGAAPRAVKRPFRGPSSRRSCVHACSSDSACRRLAAQPCERLLRRGRGRAPRRHARAPVGFRTTASGRRSAWRWPCRYRTAAPRRRRRRQSR